MVVHQFAIGALSQRPIARPMLPCSPPPPPLPAAHLARLQVHHSFRYRKRSRTVADTGEEAYLRVDIPCGCGTACAACPPTLPALALQGGGSSSGSGRAESGPRQAHLLMPDAAALLDSLEVLELPEVENVVLLTSEVRQVGWPAGPATYRIACPGGGKRQGRVHLCWDELLHSAASMCRPSQSSSHTREWPTR